MSRQKSSALVVSGSPDARLEAMLAQCGLSVVTAPDTAQATARLASTLFDVVLLPISAEPEALARVTSLHDACSDTPIVAFGADEPELTHAALRAGASEYLVWPSPLQTVSLCVAAASTQ